MRTRNFFVKEAVVILHGYFNLRFMIIEITEQELQAARLDEATIRVEVAILLYQRGGISLGRASQFARMNKIEFQEELGKRQIPLNYDIEELEYDARTLGLK